VPFRDFVAPAMCASAGLWPSSFETTFSFFWRMEQAHVHTTMLATPIEPEEIVLGELLWASTRGLLYAAACTGDGFRLAEPQIHGRRARAVHPAPPRG